ncbi:hypothetical protein DXG03_007405 [Asterophora parasitica]|uniref:Uncharacterized protein n=1 Tax=Asterophora parasitica TaxID=117018 RepID=A0A9P7KDK4_9AGAR|nr:hypothetical protein DXG03_007405 [Asterophora parasitica]
MTTLRTRVEEIAQRSYSSNPKLSFMSQEQAYQELMQEMERFPVVDRVASEVQLLSDTSFTENIHNAVLNILAESKGQAPLDRPPKGSLTPRFDRPCIDGDPDEHASGKTGTATLPSATLTVSHPSDSTAIPGPSVLVTPAPQSPSFNRTTLPPITTVEESPVVGALEGGLETSHTTQADVISAAAAAPSPGVSGPPIFTTSVTDVDMVDGSQPDGDAKAS